MNYEIMLIQKNIEEIDTLPNIEDLYDMDKESLLKVKTLLDTKFPKLLINYEKEKKKIAENPNHNQNIDQDNFLIDQAVRGDKINWIAGESTDSFEMIYLKKIDRFIKHLNTTCFTSIKSVESHYASYEKFRFYKRHHDQFKQEKGRDFSIILYLNVSWLEADGGILSLYPVGKSQEDIAPLGGRMIFFRSSDMEHEVHASNTRERNSIAGWLKKV